LNKWQRRWLSTALSGSAFIRLIEPGHIDMIIIQSIYIVFLMIIYYSQVASNTICVIIYFCCSCADEMLKQLNIYILRYVIGLFRLTRSSRSTFRFYCPANHAWLGIGSSLQRFFSVPPRHTPLYTSSFVVIVKKTQLARWGIILSSIISIIVYFLFGLNVVCFINDRNSPVV